MKLVVAAIKLPVQTYMYLLLSGEASPSGWVPAVHEARGVHSGWGGADCSQQGRYLLQVSSEDCATAGVRECMHVLS